MSSFANHFGEPEDDLGCHLGFGKERSKASWRSARGETCFTYLVSYSTATEIRYRGGMLGQGGVQGEDGELREDTLLQRRGAEQACPSSDHEREDEQQTEPERRRDEKRAGEWPVGPAEMWC